MRNDHVAELQRFLHIFNTICNFNGFMPPPIFEAAVFSAFITVN